MHRRSPARVVAVIVLASVGFAACSSDSASVGGKDSRTTTTVPTSTDPRGERDQTMGQNSPVLSNQSPQDRLANSRQPLPDQPLFLGDYADPFVLAVGPTLYLYTTNTVDENVPVLKSLAAVAASPQGDALPNLPKWTKPGRVWAPSVLAADGGYVLYYTSQDNQSGLQCVGAAFSKDPTGPFVDDHDGPFVCQRQLGGTIDASPFVDDDGTAWLLFKNDGNCCDIVTQLWSQQLSSDGLKLVGDPVSLLQTTQDWEGPLVEGPSMVKSGDPYWLLYSSNWWDSADYTIGAARCDAPTGPCTKLDNPWLASQAGTAGPGGPSEFTDSQGNHWLVYHAWVTDAIGYDNGGARSLFAVPLDLTGAVPVATGLTTNQP